MKSKKVDIVNLMTIKNYAISQAVTPSYIYKLTKEGKMQIVIIDNVQFVDIQEYPKIPTKK